MIHRAVQAVGSTVVIIGMGVVISVVTMKEAFCITAVAQTDMHARKDQLQAE